MKAVSIAPASVPVTAQRREARKVLSAVLLLQIVSTLAGVVAALGPFPVHDTAQPWTTLCGLAVSVTFSVAGLIATTPIRFGKERHTSAAFCTALAGLFAVAFQMQTGLRMSAVASILVLTVYIRTLHRPSVARAQCSALAVAAAVSLALGEATSSPGEIILALLCLLVFTEILGSAGASLRSAALHDPLTGAFNRTGAEHGFAHLATQLRRRTDRIAIIAFDVDNFKDLNDNYGHAVGDRVLVELVLSWSSRAPSQSVLARVGGDEFVLIAPVSTHGEAKQLAETMVARQSVSASYGLSVSMPTNHLFETLLADADADLYRRKRRLDRKTAPRQASSDHSVATLCGEPSSDVGPQL